MQHLGKHGHGDICEGIIELESESCSQKRQGRKLNRRKDGIIKDGKTINHKGKDGEAEARQLMKPFKFKIATHIGQSVELEAQ